MDNERKNSNFKRINRYKLPQSDNPDKLAEIVQELIENDFQPIGAAFVDHRGIYFQTMVRYED
ncbi:hypothetical protein [Victivallis vadensis]|uniref:hypothetical protein n=1 Tax=Victivallis vadensis TaxID=172901 RepID=UPI0023F694DB|nr:hypothetical protein [Victivallis vadensis]